MATSKPAATDAPDAPPPVRADWERIEAQYRVGTMSLREIASQHKLTEGAIRKRAKRDGWERDLTEKVKAKADALVRKELVRTEVRKETATERVTVEVEAHVQARIRIAHRADITRSRTLAMRLLEELEAETSQVPELLQLGKMMAGANDAGKLAALYDRIISLPGRTKVMKELSETLKTLIGLEREAFALGNDAGPADAIGELLGRIGRSSFPVVRDPDGDAG